MLEYILMTISNLDIGGETYLVLVIVFYMATRFYKQLKHTKKQITTIEYILEERLKESEANLKECRHDKKVANQLYKETLSKYEKLEQKINKCMNNHKS